MKSTSLAEAAVILDAVSRRFGETIAVDEVTLDIRRGEFFSLLGPSGCGKTTLLRIVAGFENPDAGRVHIQGRDVTRVAPRLRPTAMVFQNYALFPNMTVGENVEYGLKVRKVAREERRRRVLDALRRVELDALVDRPVTQLSGGQQQRVAVARAVAVEPFVLLFDEPLSNLDIALREQTRRELKVLQQRLGITSLYVTHDQQEALALSDRIAVMRHGQIVQVGAPEQLYSEPESAYVAEFLGGSNIVRDTGLIAQFTGESRPDGHVLAIRPEHIRPVDNGGIGADVVSRQFLGTMAEWSLNVDGSALRAWLEPGFEQRPTIRIEASRYRWVLES